MYEWAQLRGGPPPPLGLERGRWYRVETRTKGGLVRVLGPNAVGIPLDQTQVRLIDHEPTTITRVQASGFRPVGPGEPLAELTYYGVCPQGHRIQKLGVGDSHAECSECGETYPVDDELHYEGRK